MLNNLCDDFVQQVNGLSFDQDAEGNWGYKPSGADSVIPFKKVGEGDAIMYYLGTGRTFNIPTLMPSVDYTSLTTDNFLVFINKAPVLSNSGASVSSLSDYSVKITTTSTKPSISYTTSTGVLKVTGAAFSIKFPPVLTSNWNWNMTPMVFYIENIPFPGDGTSRTSSVVNPYP